MATRCQSIVVIPESPLRRIGHLGEHIEFVARSVPINERRNNGHAMELVEAFRLTKQLIGS